MPEQILKKATTQTEELKQVAESNISKLQSKEQQAVVKEVWADFYKAFNILQQPYRYFRDRTLVEYLDDQNKRLNDYFDADNTKQESWEPEIFDPITREKIRRDLSKLSQQRIKGEIKSWDKDIISDFIASCFNEIMDELNYNLNEDENLIYEMFNCKTEGTVVGYEGFRQIKTTFDEVEEYNIETGEAKETKRKTVYDYNDVYGCIVNLADFFVGNIFERDIQEQPYLTWRKIVKWDTFQKEFKNYKEAKKVLPKGQVILGSEPFFGITEQVSDDEVEILRYYNRRLRKYHIIANGILLTPIKGFWPFKHGLYPFWKSINEIFATNFFYGKGDPDLFMGLQDVNNQLLQMMLAQSFLAIYKPMLTESENDLSSGYLVPGRMTQVESIERMKELQISEPSGFYLRMIGLVQGRLNNLTADIVTQAGGSAKTAREISIARDIALELVSLFLRFMEGGKKQQYILRLYNMFQFYTMPIDVDEKGKPIYREFRISSGKLMFGGEGIKIVRFTDDENMPLFSQELANEKKMMMNPETTNIIKINIKKIRDFKAILKIIARSSVRDTEAVETARQLEYVDRTMGNPLFDQKEVAKELALAFKKDPEKVLAKETEQPDMMRENLMNGNTSEFVDQVMRGAEKPRFTGQKGFSLNEQMNK